MGFTGGEIVGGLGMQRHVLLDLLSKSAAEHGSKLARDYCIFGKGF
jgi:hypothetical protein